MATSGDKARMELIALAMLARSHEPTGARRLAEIYRSEKIGVAEATAGRYLRALDETGLTRSVGMRGRVLTKAGERRLEELRLQQQISVQSALVAAAADVQSLDELIDLLHVRRAVEAEAARLAATRATKAEIARIVAVADVHTHCIETCDRLEQSHNFHLLLARASRNRMLSAMAALLLDPKNDKLAVLLDRLAVESGVILDMTSDHRRIAAALQRRDAEKTERLAREHIDKMIVVATSYRELRKTNGLGGGAALFAAALKQKRTVRSRAKADGKDRSTSRANATGAARRHIRNDSA